MMTLINFEFKKFFSKKRNIIVIIAFIALILVFIKLNLGIETLRAESEFDSIDSGIESIERALIDIDSEIIRLPNNNNLKNMKYSYDKQISLLKDKKNALSNNDWQKALNAQLELDKNLLNDINHGNTVINISSDALENDIEINTILLKENIKPIYTEVSMEAFNFIKLLLNSPIMIIIMILIIIFTGDIVSSEVETKTFKVILTQPISKNKILLSKVLAAIGLMVFLFGTIIFSIFIVLGFIHGFGSIDYPMNFFTSGEISYISMGKYLFLLICIFILFINFIIIVSIFISSMSKQTTTSISTTIIISVSMYMVINQGFSNNIAHLVPFTYVDLSNIIQGISASKLENLNINFNNGCILLIIMTLVLLILNIIFFNKKDFEV